MSIQKQRVEKIKTLLTDNKEALLVTNEKNIYYYTDFPKSEGALLVTEETTYLLVDFRYYEAAQKIARDCNVVCFSTLTESLIELLKKHNINTIYLESENITVSIYTKYLKLFNEIGISLNTSGLLDKTIFNQRMIKSEIELKFISDAQKIAEKAYNEVLNYLKPGVTEIEISNLLDYFIKKSGAEDISFDLITITGKKTSLPHGVPSTDVVKEGDFFTFDIGATYKGYHSDMTRTVAIKSYTEEMFDIYNIVLKAHLDALNYVKSGIKAGEVDEIARNVISKAGYSEYFGHATGHGVGLDIHELPRVSPHCDTFLTENMVITIEPGIYIPNKFGVRIEDMVAVTEKGFKNFVSVPKELIVL